MGVGAAAPVLSTALVRVQATAGAGLQGAASAAARRARARAAAAGWAAARAAGWAAEAAGWATAAAGWAAAAASAGLATAAAGWAAAAAGRATAGAGWGAVPAAARARAGWAATAGYATRRAPFSFGGKRHHSDSTRRVRLFGTFQKVDRGSATLRVSVAQWRNCIATTGGTLRWSPSLRFWTGFGFFRYSTCPPGTQIKSIRTAQDCRLHPFCSPRSSRHVEPPASCHSSAHTGKARSSAIGPHVIQAHARSRVIV
jgi:hypothetical protein